jgi:hypothetical protein
MDDVQFTVIGSLIGMVTVITTTLYQTQTNAFERLHNLTWIPLNRAVSVARFVIALIASLAIEKYGQHRMLNDDFPVVEAIVILVTGALTLMGNRIGFSVIGWGGAITFQIVGYAATMPALALKMFTGPDRHEHVLRKYLGMWLAAVGVFSHGVFETANQYVESATTQSSELLGVHVLVCENADPRFHLESLTTQP